MPQAQNTTTTTPFPLNPTPKTDLKPEASELLQKTSSEAQELKKNIHRSTATVPWSEIEPLLTLAMNHFQRETDVFTAIGYASPNITEWKNSGHVALRIKWALKGLISELGGKAQPPAPKIFDRHELTTFMYFLSREYAKGSDWDREGLESLINKVAFELGQLPKETN